jgi:hypothetical protein
MAWLMGQMYRVYQPMFPWVFQGRRLDEDGITPVAPARGFDVVPPSAASKAPIRR